MSRRRVGMWLLRIAFVLAVPALVLHFAPDILLRMYSRQELADIFAGGDRLWNMKGDGFVSLQLSKMLEPWPLCLFAATFVFLVPGWVCVRFAPPEPGTTKN
jgi:hypothetical protein